MTNLCFVDIAKERPPLILWIRKEISVVLDPNKISETSCSWKVKMG